MATVEHAAIEDWLQRELDGDLAATERETLRRHLDQCAECREEQRELQGLDRLLTENHITVREGFRDEVLAALPPTSWESRSRRAWRLPVALLVTLVAATMALYQFAPGGAGGSVFGVFTAVADLFGVALVTGAGMLGHSWQGMRLVFAELLSGSATGILGLVALLVGLNALLFFTLRRRPRPAIQAAPRGRKED